MTKSAAAALTILAAAIAGAAHAQGAADKPAIADAKLLSAGAKGYKLDGPAIYKVNRRSKDLIAEDLNGDGLADLCVVTNEKSILELYLQNKKPEGEGDLFERAEVSLDRIATHAIARDLNGDGRMDLLVAAAPAKAIILQQDRDGRFEPAKNTDLVAGRFLRGDVNGDGREDIVAYHDGKFQLLPGEGRGLSLEPAQTFFTTGQPASDPMLIDFDGDGRTDIVYHDSQKFENLVVMLQSPEGTFPSEVRLATAVMRNVAPLPAPKGAAASVVAVNNVTRGLMQLSMAPPAKDDKTQALPMSVPHTVAFDPETKSKKSSSTVADVDGDGRQDLVVSSPDLSVLRLLRQSRSGALMQQAMPSLQGIASVEVLDVPKGEPAPLVLFSPTEKAVAFAKWDAASQTMPFPKILPVAGQPSGLVLAKIGKQQMIVAVTKAEGGAAAPKITGYPIDAAGALGKAVDLSPTGEKSPLEKLDIAGIDTMDVNRDGLVDLVVHADFKPARILVQTAKGPFAELAATSGVLEGLLSESKPGSIQPIRHDGKDDSVIALKEKFARTFFIDKDQNIVVEHQYNGRNASARLTTMANGKLRGGDSPEVILVDRGNKCLTIYGIEDPKKGEYAILANVEHDGADYSSVCTLDLDSDGREDIVLTADDRLSIIYSNRTTGGLKSVATAATTVTDGGYGKVFSADLIPGGALEIVALEMRDILMEMLELGAGEDRLPALNRFYKFRIFDSESSLARRVNMDAPPEPREVLAADLNGDGKPEIVALTHDNIIVYHPQ